MEELVLAWYAWLSRLAQPLIAALDGWIAAVPIPGLSAVLFGLIGATSPCQLTTNLSALALSARQPQPGDVVRSALAYAAGKVAVYTLVGGAVIVLGLELQAASIPVVVVARKLLGPLMLGVGLLLMGVVRLRVEFGHRLSHRLSTIRPVQGARGAFFLGVAFSFAFCPTLFWLFFGLTLPLALGDPAGWSFPGLFAVGTSLPLLVGAGGVALGLGAVERVAGKIARLHRAATVAAGIVFVLAGLHDTLVYWWI
jgi:cytochrome c-type biogenesis protein